MNKTLNHALLILSLIAGAGLAQAQGNAPDHGVAPSGGAPQSPPQAQYAPLEQGASVAPSPQAPSVNTYRERSQERLSRDAGATYSQQTQRSTVTRVPRAPAASASDLAQERLLGRGTQKIERLHFEDAGNKVDELRVGGQTQSITVTPKNGAPAYQVVPQGAQNVLPDGTVPPSTARWKIFSF